MGLTVVEARDATRLAASVSAVLLCIATPVVAHVRRHLERRVLDSSGGCGAACQPFVCTLAGMSAAETQSDADGRFQLAVARTGSAR